MRKVAVIPIVMLLCMAAVFAQTFDGSVDFVAGDYAYNDTVWNGTGSAQNTTTYVYNLPNSTYAETVSRYNITVYDVDAGDDFNVNVTVDGTVIADNQTVPSGGSLTLNVLSTVALDSNTDDTVDVTVETLVTDGSALLDTEHIVEQDVFVENVTVGLVGVTESYLGDPFVTEDKDDSYYTVDTEFVFNNTNDNFTIDDIVVNFTYPTDARNEDATGTTFTISSLDYTETYDKVIGYQKYGPYISGKSIDEGTTNVMEFTVKSPLGFSRVDFYLTIEDYPGFFPQFNTDTLVVEVNGQTESYEVVAGSTIIEVENFDLDAGTNDITLTWTPSTVSPPTVPTVPDFWNTPYGPFTGMQWTAIVLILMALGAAVFLLTTPQKKKD